MSTSNGSMIHNFPSLLIVVFLHSLPYTFSHVCNFSPRSFATKAISPGQEIQLIMRKEKIAGPSYDWPITLTLLNRAMIGYSEFYWSVSHMIGSLSCPDRSYITILIHSVLCQNHSTKSKHVKVGVDNEHGSPLYANDLRHESWRSRNVIIGHIQVFSSDTWLAQATS